jgi:shikimate dehydrogenase
METIPNPGRKPNDPPGNPIDKDTQLCMSLSGRPGNFGTLFHNALYQELGLNYIYKAFTTSDIAAAVGGIRALGVRGCAVSMPFKEVCIPFVDEVHPSAGVIRSINTIVNDNGRLRAYNTDYIAVAKLLERHGISNTMGFALRGSGGMAKAVAHALRDAGFSSGHIVARNAAVGQRLAGECGYGWCAELGSLAPQLLINATPIGMAGGVEAEELAFASDLVDRATAVFDVVAVPAETPLIRYARNKRKTVVTGAEVIVLQAVEQFILYTGVRPSGEQIERAFAIASVALQPK